MTWPRAVVEHMVEKIVGDGVFARVKLEVTSDGVSRAIKVYEHRVGAPGSEHQRTQEMHIANEVRLAGRLSHAHIIAPHEVRVGAQRTELTMEYAPNGTLEAYTLGLGPLGIAEAAGRGLFVQLLSAVAYLHGQKVAHRDIKLENVMLDAKYRARLIDFGSACDVRQPPASGGGGASGLSAGRLHLLQGTPGYMSPEVLQGALSGHGGYDLRAADVWALGVCLYCLFNHTGLPFRAKDARSLLQAVTQKDPPPPAHLSANGSALLRALLSKRPDARPTAAAAADHQWLSGPLCPASPRGSPAKRWPPAAKAAADDLPPPYGLGNAPIALSRPWTAKEAPGCAHMAATVARGRAAHEDATRAHVDAARAVATAYRVSHPTPPHLAGTEAAAAAAAARNRELAAGGFRVEPASSSRPSNAAHQHAMQIEAVPGFGLRGYAPPSNAKGRGGAAAAACWRAPPPSGGGAHGPNADLPPEFCASVSVRSFAQLGL